jgi:hypothetical protein
LIGRIRKFRQTFNRLACLYTDPKKKLKNWNEIPRTPPLAGVNVIISIFEDFLAKFWRFSWKINVFVKKRLYVFWDKNGKILPFFENIDLIVSFVPRYVMYTGDW